MLKCNIRGVENGYPLIIEAETVEEIPSDFDADLIRTMLGKINWSCFMSALSNLNVAEIDLLKDKPPEDMLASEDILLLIHKLLFDTHIQEANLVCPESGRKFPVKDGIPNMLLHEDEI